MESEEKIREEELPPPSLISDSQRHTSQSPSDIMVNALLAEKRLRNAAERARSTDKSDSELASNNNGSVAKIPNDSSLHRRSVGEGGDENDPLLRTIKAQHSLTKQLTDEMTESSTRSPRSEPHSDIRGGASFDHRDSETEF